MRYQNLTWYVVLLLTGGLLFTPVSAGEIWDITTADATTDVGRFSSLAIGTDDCPAVSYQDYEARVLKYAWNDGSGWQTDTIDADKSVGYHTSLILDAENHAAICYYDAINEDLKYARHNGIDWQITTIDTAGAVGWYTSLAWDNDGHPAVSYQNFSQLDLKYAWNDGAGWETMTIDTAGDLGQYSSLAFDAAGAPAISYYDATNADLKFARRDGTDWQITTIDAAGEVGQYSSLAFDAAGAPSISYYDATNADLKFARHDGTDWQITTIDAAGNAGESTSLAYDTTGHPAISYTDTSAGDLKYARLDGTAWQISTIDTGEGKFEYTSLAFDTTSHPAISYSDETTGTLKYASCRFTGSLQVTSVPAGAAIWIDGLDTGELTNSTITLAPADYNVTVLLAGYEEPAIQTVTVADGANVDAVFNLVTIPEPQGDLTITSVPAGAAIWIDGLDTGEITNYTFALAPADYNVTVQLAGYEEPAIQTVAVADGANVDAAFNLVTIPEPQGNLTITSVPAGAAIWIDGLDTGELTNSTITLAPADYNVTVLLAGYEEPAIQTVTVADGANVDAAFNLVPIPEPQGDLTITSVPAGAAIWIDGLDTGELTNSTITLAPADYNVTVQLAGYEEPAIQTVTVTDGANVDAVFNLVPIPEPQGDLTITSVPAGAAIWIDGLDTGELTNSTMPLAPADYNVTVQLAGYKEPAIQTVTVADGANVDAVFNLVSIPVNVTVEVALSAGWNMISVPVVNATVIVPPEAVSVYRYNVNIYEPVDDLASVPPGEGIWVSATGPCTLTFTGQALDCYREQMSPGWNMIGSCTEMVPFTDHLVSDPAGALTDQIYTYDTDSGTYMSPASCNPGCGYWVLASTGCEICLT